MKPSPIPLLRILFLVSILCALPSATFAVDATIESSACLECHADPAAERHIDAVKFQASVHASLRCVACHADIKEVPHETPLKKVSCGGCHRVETEVYLHSDHGLALKAGVSEAASCRSCHGDPHQLLNSRNPASSVYRANIPATCAQCHGKVDEMLKFHLSQKAPVASYDRSVHGLALRKQGGISPAAVCSDCHGTHDLHKSSNPKSKLYWQNIPSTCGKCHENVSQTYLRSVHGRGVQSGKRDAPVCTDCHGEHSISAVNLVTSKVYPAQIPETCGQCHGTERIIAKYGLPAHVVDTYMQSFHGLALQMGSLTAANCASCHGAHDVLPSDDPNSSVNPKNLAKTCGKCHAGVGNLVAKGQIHSGMRPGLEHRTVSYVRWFYWIVIFLTIGAMALHNGLDFFKKLFAHYRRMRAAGHPGRMSGGERLQHAILFIAFTALAYTGFALTFPSAWWARPLVGQTDWRGLSHRAAALLFVTLCVFHVLFMVFSPRGRKHLIELLPRKVDFVQPLEMMGFYLGLRKQRPVFARYSYVEKAEYWALVWGSIVMVLTGGLMTCNEWMLKVFPKWFFDVVTAIHYYEAVLACSAIVVWHFYFVIFDPDEYPMKWSWITGWSSPKDDTDRKEGAP